MAVTLQTLANAAVSPLAICIFMTLAATAPPEMRTICFAMFGVYSLVFGGFAGSVILGAVSDAIGGLHGIVVSLTIIAPVCLVGGFLLILGSRSVKRDITLVIEDVIERYTEGKRRQEGGEIPALQVHNLDFYYGTNQVLFDVNLEVEQGEMVALLGTNGAGKSTLLRAVSGLSHPAPRRGPDLRDELHLPRTRADHRPGRGPAGGREDDLPRPVGARQPAHRRAHHATGPGQVGRRPGGGAGCLPRAGRTGSNSRPGRCRAGSSRCWLWPGS